MFYLLLDYAIIGKFYYINQPNYHYDIRNAVFGGFACGELARLDGIASLVCSIVPKIILNKINCRYWVMGMFLSSLFVVGHDCGHGTFSEYNWVNDLFGHLAHAPIMAPYWPWQKSHRQHHQYTSHLEKDKGHPWTTEQEYSASNLLVKHFSKIPLSGLLRLFLWICKYKIFVYSWLFFTKKVLYNSTPF